MATDTATAPINGTYVSQQSYNAAGHPLSSHPPNASNAGANGANGGHPSASAGNNGSAGNGDSNGVSKDEVGWYFVEQYYTTLSRSPEKLHLFYSKRSQFVSGVEAEKVSVSVGQRAINERIKELDIQDCKVRVSNVDSMESFKNIVVQVIGEMSNKAAPHRKFAQTFVLAEQPNGYFVLNDIFRYIAEEEEGEVDHIPAKPEAREIADPTAEHKTLTSSNDPISQEEDAELIDKKLEETVPELLAENATANGAATDGASIAQPDAAEEHAVAPVTADEEVKAPAKEEDAETAAAEDLAPEAPKDPVSTPVVPSPKLGTIAPARAATPAAPPKPAAPKTWASMLAANRPNNPAASSTASSTSSTPAQQKQATPAPTSNVPPPIISKDDTATQPLQSPGSEWQTAGQDKTKGQSRQQSGSISNGTQDKGNVLGYVKNVTDRVDASLLRTTLSEFGKLAYFDVSRPKNCAFVEFADAAGYNAAVAANPHSVGGEQIYVEERRPRATAYGGNFNNRGGMRGGRGSNENRPPSQGRGGFPKEGGRGGFAPRGARGGMAPRGRGTPQVA